MLGHGVCLRDRNPRRRFTSLHSRDRLRVARRRRKARMHRPNRARNRITRRIRRAASTGAIVRLTAICAVAVAGRRTRVLPAPSSPPSPGSAPVIIQPTDATTWSPTTIVAARVPAVVACATGTNAIRPSTSPSSRTTTTGALEAAKPTFRIIARRRASSPWRSNSRACVMSGGEVVDDPEV